MNELALYKSKDGNIKLDVNLTDGLRQDEVNSTLKSLEKLEETTWGRSFTNSKKIRKSINLVKKYEEDFRRLDSESTIKFNKNQIISIKSDFFEIRFAAAIRRSGLDAEYEFKTGVGKKSVDFKVGRKNSENNLLIELTSMRDSEAVKKAAFQNENFYVFVSDTVPPNTKNSIEIQEIIKIQKIISDKAKKFPKINPNSYHVIIVDVRGLHVGVSDIEDYKLIAYGMVNAKNDCYERNFVDQNGSSRIRGIFEESHPDKKVREKIHALVFIKEKTYNETEKESIIFYNPNLILNDDGKRLFNRLF